MSWLVDLYKREFNVRYSVDVRFRWKNYTYMYLYILVSFYDPNAYT